ncbi:hypothetical protein [Nocardia sp. NPDC047648]|uniref:hypothetical protein n=1 Tax=Nocardia sp. NPDC047648 TaxID=3155625 RepID=UPI0033FBB76C
MGFNWWQEEDAQRGTSVQDIVDRVQAEWRASQQGLSGWSHVAPQMPLSVEEAHVTMQQHRGCRAAECPRKDAARQTLIKAGRMKPDTSREY